jgi:hypothetical protein
MLFRVSEPGRELLEIRVEARPFAYLGGLSREPKCLRGSIECLTIFSRIPIHT